MTKEEWLATLDPEAVLQALPRNGVSGRKWRLAAAAFCRRVWPLLADERSRAAVEAAERYADKLITSAEAMEIEGAAAAVTERGWPDGQDASNDASGAAAVSLALWAQPDYGAMMAMRWTAGSIGRKGQVEVLNCIFGIPYRRHAVIPPSWLTSTVVALANGIYADRAFDRLPVLADALEEAGCDDPEVLRHCRGDCGHALGCWVVDLVLNKT